MESQGLSMDCSMMWCQAKCNYALIMLMLMMLIIMFNLKVLVTIVKLLSLSELKQNIFHGCHGKAAFLDYVLNE